ncbi:MAG: TIGR03564 family F420-dependent LLM class oxidoreductase [Ilumatobacter sp.]|uniref:TIGR03564 family F420-dependent LLM class oxidoreductase n=1 Tax=Ilumatobacter sp. TaxID=1967498 RepID=UPI00262B6F28|nr:TIGR03564 family F420-dependent LLM class oxidoreductase [Ilumatobacter sp.]MDJ0767212.1 TIGR03564 family F420-dependent LLM class oxidoreductase [Ilumatobacter sp.]
MRIGINGSDKLVNPDLDRIIVDIEEAESEGFATYWLAQTGLLDATATLGLAGTRTSTITLGTAVVPTWERHPRSLAAQALTAQAASGGRIVLGIGLSHRPVVEGQLRMTWDRPVRHMIDYLDVLLPLLHEGNVSHQGEIWSYMGGGGRPTEQAPSVMLAALGEQMLRLAGSRTDGTILWCVGPRTIEQQIRPLIEQAADAAGRPAPSIVCSLPVWVTDDTTAAKDFVGSILKDYAALPSYRAMLDIEGVQGIESISLIGSEQQVTDGLAAIAQAGATDFTAVVMGGNADELALTRETLAAYAG